MIVSVLAGTINAMNAGRGEKRAVTGSGTASRKRLALFLLCLASFMAVVDTTIVSILLLLLGRAGDMPKNGSPVEQEGDGGG
jgi:hypothetical protein